MFRSTSLALMLAAMTSCMPGRSTGPTRPMTGAGGTSTDGSPSGGSGGSPTGGSPSGGSGGTPVATGGSGGHLGSGGAPGSSGGSGGTPSSSPDAAPRPADAAASPRPDAAPSPPDAAATGGAGGSCPGEASSADVAVDATTCLAWERRDPRRDVSACPLQIRTNESKLCWDEAVKFCTALRLDGKSDWRLPTIAELKTLVIADNAPALDATIFPDAIADLYWSSEKLGEKIVAIDFSNHGMVNDHIGPDGPQAFRCVRSAK